MVSQQSTQGQTGKYGIFDSETENAIEMAIQQAIEDKTEIGDIGNEPVFRLCQYLSGIISQKDHPADTLKPIVHDFYQKHPELHDYYDFFEIMLMFSHIWDNEKVKNPKMAYLKIAIMRADKDTENRPESAWIDNERMRRLDNVCFHMQKLTGENPFWISQYQAGEIIGRSDTLGREYLDGLEMKGNLLRHKTGNYGNRKANEYFYIRHPAHPHKSADGKNPIAKKMISDLLNDVERNP